MKLRIDFITNSSSSSFILSFKNEESIYRILKEQFPENIEPGCSAGDEGYLNQLLNDVFNAERLSREDVVEMIRDEDWIIRWKLRRELEIKGMSYNEIEELFKSPEGEKMVNEACEKEIERVMKKIGDDEVIVEIIHGDGGNGEDGMLEHEILPNMECTVTRFSHH